MSSRALVSISGSALSKNYRIISEKVPQLGLIPMVKADAYGHGAGFVGKVLSQERNFYAFGVATFQEAVSLRATLKGPKIPILVFSDSVPWTHEKARLCLSLGLEPVFSEVTSLLKFQSGTDGNRIPAHVEFNTGMNRLGIPIESLSLVRFYPKTVFTHLADADSPDSTLTRLQIKRFSELVPEVRARFPKAKLHFANSAALWNPKRYPLLKQMDLARPGLSLYGIRPFDRARNEGLKRVMRFSARVINRIYLEYGDRVGYGGIYRCSKPSGEWVGVIAAGYADGVFRALGNQGVAYFGSKKLVFRGRVSMDLSAIECPSRLQVGDEVELWGDRVDPYEQARLAGTIPYEITTRIGHRVERNYEF